MKTVTGRSSDAASKAKQRLSWAMPLVDCVLTLTSLTVGLGVIFGIAALADMEVLNAEGLKMFLSGVCPLITMSQFISPTPTVMEALRKLDVGTLPTPVFISQSACNIISMAYGIRIQNKVVLASNLFGLGCQIMYLSSNHFVLAANGGWFHYVSKLQLIYCASLYVCTEVLSLELLGQIITLFNIVLFAAPLSALGTILRTRNASSLPTAMIAISCLSNAVWSLYALLIKDMVVLLPSILGFLLCLFQVLVLLWGYHVLPFDLGFILLPCRFLGSQGKKVGIEAGQSPVDSRSNPEVTLDENAFHMDDVDLNTI